MHGASNRCTHLYPPHNNSSVHDPDNNIRAAHWENHQWNSEWADNPTRLHIFIPDTGTYPGVTLPRTTWVRLYRLRTDVGRFPSCLHKWGMASSAACEYGAEEQTVDHVVLQCPIQRWAESPCSDSDSAPGPRFKTPAPAPTPQNLELHLRLLSTLRKLNLRHFTSLASPLCVEIFGEIYVIMNVLWSVVQSLCGCVQKERLGLQFNVKNIFVKAAFKTVYVKLKRSKAVVSVYYIYVCEDCGRTV